MFHNNPVYSYAIFWSYLPFHAHTTSIIQSYIKVIQYFIKFEYTSSILFMIRKYLSCLLVGNYKELNSPDTLKIAINTIGLHSDIIQYAWITTLYS